MPTVKQLSWFNPGVISPPMHTKLKNEPVEYITCPFCGELNFDKVGLKGHLVHGDCEPYNKIQKYEEWIARTAVVLPAEIEVKE